MLLWIMFRDTHRAGRTPRLAQPASGLADSANR